MAITVLDKDLTLYVRPDGNDGNAGLSDTSDGAFGTIQRAIEEVYESIDLAGHDVFIQLAHGFYPNTNAIARGPHRGGGRIFIQGDPDNISKVVVDSGDDPVAMATIWAVEGATLHVRWFHVRALRKRSFQIDVPASNISKCSVNFRPNGVWRGKVGSSSGG